jgi:hypothetical protein
MIVVSGNLEGRLDTIWWRLQNVISKQHPDGISQADLDKETVREFEVFVKNLERVTS